MATSGPSYEDELSTAHNINVIFYSYSREVRYTLTLDNTNYKFNNIEELIDYLKENVENGRLYVDKVKLEQNYLRCLISKYSKKVNKGAIDWRYDYDSLSFKKMNRLVYNIPITVDVTIVPDGMGGAGESTISLLIKIISKLKALFIFIKNFPTLKKAYEFFFDNYEYEEKFIDSVIKEEYEWKKGFIDSNIYDKKEIFEKKIMRKLNYKFYKEEKVWRKY
ncbi:MAG: hypothetical protein HFE81_03240 [Bacilli bacterium]|nr:hypothetical protein [Bacilli bacterium]